MKQTNWKFILIIVILAVIAGGAILWWSFQILPMTKPTLNYCSENSDCVLAYSSCSCEAVNTKYNDQVEQELLQEGQQYFVNQCDLDNMVAICKDGECVKIKGGPEISTGYTEKCGNLQRDIERKIEKLNYCNNNTDCLIHDFRCPFECGSYINKAANLTEINDEIASYYFCETGEREGPVCKYRCLMPSSPVCVQNKCVAEEEIIPSSSKKEVIITTDKTKYKQGETIEITTMNDLDKSIWYIKETCPLLAVIYIGGKTMNGKTWKTQCPVFSLWDLTPWNPMN